MIHKTLMAVLQKVGLSDEDEDYDDKAHAKTAAGLALSLLFFLPGPRSVVERFLKGKEWLPMCK